MTGPLHCLTLTWNPDWLGTSTHLDPHTLGSLTHLDPSTKTHTWTPHPLGPLSQNTHLEPWAKTHTWNPYPLGNPIYLEALTTWNPHPLGSITHSVPKLNDMFKFSSMPTISKLNLWNQINSTKFSLSIILKIFCNHYIDTGQHFCQMEINVLTS